MKGLGSFCEVGVKGVGGKLRGSGGYSQPRGPNSLICSLTRPTRGVARGVDDPKHMDQVIFDDIKNAIGKPGQQGSTNAWQNFGIEAGDLFEAFQLKLKSQFKLRTQPWALCLVPFVSCTQLPDGTAREFQAVRHDPLFSCNLT